MTTTANNAMPALNDEQKLKKYSKDLYDYTEGLLKDVSVDGKQQSSSDGARKVSAKAAK